MVAMAGSVTNCCHTGEETSMTFGRNLLQYHVTNLLFFFLQSSTMTFDILDNKGFRDDICIYLRGHMHSYCEQFEVYNKPTLSG